MNMIFIAQMSVKNTIKNIDEFGEVRLLLPPRLSIRNLIYFKKFFVGQPSSVPRIVESLSKLKLVLIKT